jgi:hypothetical protein
MAELTNNISTCNYTSLGNYNGIGNILKKPNTLGNINNPYVKYPVDLSKQNIPVFAGTTDYSKPNYNVLNKGSCYNYAGINQAYIDCSNTASSQGCASNGGQCVNYISRSC